jgi:hypothetical protein
LEPKVVWARRAVGRGPWVGSRVVGVGRGCGAVWDTGVCVGAWRSLVARTVRVGEVPSSNLGAPIGSCSANSREHGRKPPQARALAGGRSPVFAAVRWSGPPRIHRSGGENPPQIHRSAPGRGVAAPGMCRLRASGGSVDAPCVDAQGTSMPTARTSCGARPAARAPSARPRAVPRATCVPARVREAVTQLRLLCAGTDDIPMRLHEHVAYRDRLIEEPDRTDPPSLRYI